MMRASRVFGILGLLLFNNAAWIYYTRQANVLSYDQGNYPLFQNIVDEHYTDYDSDWFQLATVDDYTRVELQSEQGLYKIPKHIGFIVDGNGRWATRQGMIRTQGHDGGYKNVQNIIHAAHLIGVDNLTFYIFSVENFNRDENEVAHIMKLLEKLLDSVIDASTQEDYIRSTKINFIGNLDIPKIPTEVVEKIKMVKNIVVDAPEITITMAFSYTGRDSIARAATSVMKQKLESIDKNYNPALKIADQVTPVSMSDISQHIETADLPDLDLIVRTSGEKRLSGFLTWESAYTEFIFEDTTWPNYDADMMMASLRGYQSRDRRFGRQP